MELSGDCAETKPAMTRKLRRRAHEPAPLPDKRRGKSALHPAHINYLAEDKEIEADLKAILRGQNRGSTGPRKPGKFLYNIIKANFLTMVYLQKANFPI